MEVSNADELIASTSIIPSAVDIRQPHVCSTIPARDAKEKQAGEGSKPPITCPPNMV